MSSVVPQSTASSRNVSHRPNCAIHAFESAYGRHTRIMKIRNGLALTLAAAAFVSGCSSEPPNVVGTWVGDYRFALADGSDNSSVETLVITRQEGNLLWGYEQWEEDGEQMRADLTGTLTDGNGIVLTEPAGFFEGEVSGDTMLVVFTKVNAEGHTAFEVSLTRQ